MHFIDYIRLAFHNILRQKLRSVLTIFAVVIGATSVTIMLALVTGAKTFFISQFNANGTLQQVAVSPKADIVDFGEASNGGGNNCDSCVKLNDSLATKIKAIPHVVDLSRKVSAGAFEAIIYGDKKLTMNQIEGYDANGVITNNVLAGRDISAGDKDGAITITSDYANKFGFKGNYQGLVGKQVQLLSRSWYRGVGATIPEPCMGPNCQPDNGQQNNPPTTLTATVVGIIDSGDRGQTIRAPLPWVLAMNENRSYQVTPEAQQAAQNACRNSRAPCNSQPQPTLVVQNYLDQNGYDNITVKADSSTSAAGVATEIKKLGVGAADAQSFIDSQLKIFDILGLVLGGIGGIAMLVAAIGVINTMVMSILERTREIGVMRAVGAKRSTVSRLFTFEASLLGFLGGVFGVAAGFGLTRIANVFINKQLSTNGLKSHNIINLPLWLILAVIGISTLIGLLAGLYPAHRAAKLNPVDALRYE